jgi:carbon storage regulator
MLVLSRLAGEQIYIDLEDGRRITIMMVEIRGFKSRIGIDAPRTVVVHRKEIADAIAAEKRAADSQSHPGIGEDYA